MLEPRPRLLLRGLKTALVGPFDLDAGPGECVVVTGASGSGKSLFLRAIADLDPNEGEVRHGVDRASMAAPEWRRRVNYVASESGWWGERVGEHFGDLAADRALGARLGLKAEIFDGAVSRLSTGEKQRLALIRALIAAPAVLLLDEPTAALDPDSVEAVEALLRERMDEGLIVVLVTHDFAQAARIGSRRLEMRAGRLWA